MCIKNSLRRIPTVCRAGYIPGDRLTSWVYSTTCVQYLYISCYLLDNKPVLSYLLWYLLPQWWPRSGCTLCIVHCTFVHSHVGSHQRQPLSLPPSYTIFCFKFCGVHSIGYNFHSIFSLAISFRNQQFSPKTNTIIPVLENSNSWRGIWKWGRG